MKYAARFHRLLLFAFCMGITGAVRGGTETAGLGPLGEVPIWLFAAADYVPFDTDPFEPVGGEAAFAAMTNPQWKPVAGKPLVIQNADGGDAVRLSKGNWDPMRMVSPDMPGIWNEYPRLEVPQYGYAYCRLVSPRALEGGLLTGISRNACRIYLNGELVGEFQGGHGWEFARELPIRIKEGVNHLFVRFGGETALACRLIGEHAEPLRFIRAELDAEGKVEWPDPAPPAVSEDKRLANRAQQIPPLAPHPNPEILGLNLGRTMALLETGRYTHRPVRIVFSGQSIETEWTRILVQTLRERYPGTEIIAENRAIGGWFVWRMQKLLKHDIIPFQPDLVLFSAYQGTAEVWERLLSELREKTNADIVIRTGHIAAYSAKPSNPENTETRSLRRLAQKYDVELIEVSREWLEYLDTHQLQPTDLLRDKVHLNPKGETLMALLYERHFRYNPAARGWADTVRRFDVGAFLEDYRTDGIVLEGTGWNPRHGGRFAVSNSGDDRLRLRFYGTRVDLVMPPTHGRAEVRIDGRKPSELELYHGTRPQPRTMTSGARNIPMTYHLGTNLQQETWLLKLTERNEDEDEKKAGQRVKFELIGSKTGFDGEGWNDRKFVSNSGRIVLLPDDWMTRQEPPKPGEPEPEMKPYGKAPEIVWHVFPDGHDVVPHGPGWRKDVDYYFGQAYDYVTVANGLPCGVHELTLTPIPESNPHRAFSIVGIDVFRPPLARDTSEATNRP